MVAILPHLTRLIAGVQVPNTPLINSSIALARAALPDHGYNHIMRSWLNGQAIINHLPRSNRSIIDQEAFGVASILHDLGWALGTEWVSSDKRFEIDGAMGARSFIQNASYTRWPPHRLQLVWDAVALHTQPDIARYKQAEVSLVSAGIFTEFLGPVLATNFFGDLITVTQEEWQRIADAFPTQGLRGYVKDVLVGLCRLKPETTYLNPVGDYGEKYVEGYTRVGHRLIDLLESTLPVK